MRMRSLEWGVWAVVCLVVLSTAATATQSLNQGPDTNTDSPPVPPATATTATGAEGSLAMPGGTLGVPTLQSTEERAGGERPDIDALRSRDGGHELYTTDEDLFNAVDAALADMGELNPKGKDEDNSGNNDDDSDSIAACEDDGTDTCANPNAGTDTDKDTGMDMPAAERLTAFEAGLKTLDEDIVAIEEKIDSAIAQAEAKNEQNTDTDMDMPAAERLAALEAELGGKSRDDMTIEEKMDLAIAQAEAENEQVALGLLVPPVGETAHGRARKQREREAQEEEEYQRRRKRDHNMIIEGSDEDDGRPISSHKTIYGTELPDGTIDFGGPQILPIRMVKPAPAPKTKIETETKTTTRTTTSVQQPSQTRTGGLTSTLLFVAQAEPVPELVGASVYPSDCVVNATMGATGGRVASAFIDVMCAGWEGTKGNDVRLVVHLFRSSGDGPEKGTLVIEGGCHYVANGLHATPLARQSDRAQFIGRPMLHCVQREMLGISENSTLIATDFLDSIFLVSLRCPTCPDEALHYKPMGMYASTKSDAVPTDIKVTATTSMPVVTPVPAPAPVPTQMPQTPTAA